MNGWGGGNSQSIKEHNEGSYGRIMGVGVNEYWTSCIEIGRLKGQAYHIGGSSGLLGC